MEAAGFRFEQLPVWQGRQLQGLLSAVRVGKGLEG